MDNSFVLFATHQHGLGLVSGGTTNGSIATILYSSSMARFFKNHKSLETGRQKKEKKKLLSTVTNQLELTTHPSLQLSTEFNVLLDLFERL
ncbi:unnamed protein product [Acanthoscelides obtectus]|uniref:Uncharacterized protein n=2 Tax=Acanthoscelides obtectus TaxID=200917 RepID=A0A9P0KD20_ACAOB|nr:unnamed protein product [Acanthoscelides obtectus]CAK1655509.1 hypothetical protein AOBTE_LOCUS19197 [Acanthoscelides obtectus]